MKLINIFGAPGAGKSTTSAGLFRIMKLKKYNVELVTEVAKDLVWEKREQCLKDQLYISALQNHRLERLRDKVDYAITDSPLLLSLIYVPDNYYGYYSYLMKEIFNSYDNYNFYLKRVKSYSKVGRLQNEKQSNKIGSQIYDYMYVNKIDFQVIDGDEDASQKIFDIIK